MTTKFDLKAPKPGAYVTTKAHRLPKPDKRLRGGWLSTEGVPAGTVVIVTVRSLKDDDIAAWRRECTEVTFELPGGYSIPGKAELLVDGKAGGLARDVGYLLDTSERTYAEATAVTTSMELHHWRYGTIEGWWTRTRAESMHGYGVGDADVTHIHTHLLAAAPTIRRGGLITEAGRAAISWLDEHAPELRAAGVASRRTS